MLYTSSGVHKRKKYLFGIAKALGNRDMQGTLGIASQIYESGGSDRSKVSDSTCMRPTWNGFLLFCIGKGTVWRNICGGKNSSNIFQSRIQKLNILH